VTDERCAICARVVAVRGRQRICTNCQSIAKSARCVACGELRRVAGRDLEGKPWCQRCRNRRLNERADDDRRQLIVEVITATEPTLDEDLVRQVLTDTVTSRQSLRRLAVHLSEHPDVFAVGPTSVLPILDRFTRALIASGAESIATIHPVCDDCGRREARKGRSGDDGLCSMCCARGSKQTCSSCGVSRRVATRDRESGAVCYVCARQLRRRQRLDDLSEQIATVLAGAVGRLCATKVTAVIERTAPTVFARAGLVQCLRDGPTLNVSAHRTVVVARLLAALRAEGATVAGAICADCNEPADPLRIYGSVVRCLACDRRRDNQRVRRSGPPRARCVECGNDPRSGLADDHRCRQCRRRAERHCGRCQQTTGLARQDDGWICRRCALESDLNERLGPFDQMPTALAPIRAAILAADNSKIVRRWLRTSTAGQLLERLAGGEVPLTHDTLDDVDDDRSIRHLRALLVASGALADEDRGLDQLERFFDYHLNTRIADPADRKVVRAWLKWQVLARLRKRADSGESMAHSANNSRGALRSVAERLDQLADHDRNLQTATQADLDCWFAHPGAKHWLARPFLIWARQRHHLSRQIRLPPTPAQAPHPTVDDPGRWEIARQLVADDTLAVDDRVAAALVVLYGQSLSRIVRLTITDVLHGPDGTVALNVDGYPMPIHEPFATLIAKLPTRRTNGVTDQIASSWLFPGGHAGKPISPFALGRRLQAIGIEPRIMRNSARAQLVTEIPPAVLGKLIGINPGTASRWATLTSSNWIAYAANQATKGSRVQSDSPNAE
jgi:hypothetical protein